MAASDNRSVPYAGGSPSGPSMKILTNPVEWAEQQVAGEAHGVSAVVHHMDHMYRVTLTAHVSAAAGTKGYFDEGDAWSRKLDQIVTEVSPSGLRPASILEFASGYGRVTRHLSKYFPGAALTACDIHPNACRFLENVLEVHAIQSHADPAKVDLRGPYDLISAMSFFSHMPNESFGLWLAALWSALAPDGILMFSTHGPAMVPGGADSDEYTACVNGHFVYSPSSEQSDLDPTEYGSTFVNVGFVLGQLNVYTPGARVFVDEGGWFTQDLFVLRKSAA